VFLPSGTAWGKTPCRAAKAIITALSIQALLCQLQAGKIAARLGAVVNYARSNGFLVIAGAGARASPRFVSARNDGDDSQFGLARGHRGRRLALAVPLVAFAHKAWS